MIITIQPLKKGYEIIKSEVLVFPSFSQFEITKVASILAELIFKQTGVRPTIKILPMERTPVMRVNPGFIKAVDNFINSNTPMAMKKKTYPAKKKAVVKKAKKVVKKAGKR